MKSPWLVPTLVIAVVIAGGCSRDHGTLRIAVNNGVEGVALKYVAAAFANKNNVTIDIVELPYEDLYKDELDHLENGDSAYDVIMVDDPWLTPLLIGTKDGKEVERLAPMDLTGKAAENSKGFIATCLDVCRHPRTGALYALPFVGNTQLFLYRRTNAEPAPQSWEEILTRKSVLDADKKVGYVMRVHTGNSIVTDFLPILWSAWQHDPSDAGTVKALSQLKQLGPALAFRQDDETLSGPNLSLVAADDFDLAIHLVRGQASMSIIWSAWLMAMTNASADTQSSRDQLYVTAVPGGHPAIGAWLLAIPKGSQRIPLAKEFLIFATDEAQMLEAARRGNPPTRKAVLQDSVLNKTYPWFPCQMQSLENARARPRITNWRKVETDLGATLSDLYAGVVKEPQEAMARIQPQLAHFPKTTPTNSDVTCIAAPLLGH